MVLHFERKRLSLKDVHSAHSSWLWVWFSGISVVTNSDAFYPAGVHHLTLIDWRLCGICQITWTQRQWANIKHWAEAFDKFCQSDMAKWIEHTALCVSGNEQSRWWVRILLLPLEMWPIHSDMYGQLWSFHGSLEHSCG